jgi:hypothetical protein
VPLKQDLYVSLFSQIFYICFEEFPGFHFQKKVHDIRFRFGKWDQLAGNDLVQFEDMIAELDEIIPSQLIPFSETKTDIMNLLLKMKTRKLFETYVEDLGKKANIQVLF